MSCFSPSMRNWPRLKSKVRIGIWYSRDRESLCVTLYALSNNLSVDFGSLFCRVIVDRFRSFAKKKHGLPYACLITRLAMFAGLTFSDSGPRVSLQSPFSLAGVQKDGKNKQIQLSFTRVQKVLMRLRRNHAGVSYSTTQLRKNKQIQYFLNQSSLILPILHHFILGVK